MLRYILLRSGAGHFSAYGDRDFSRRSSEETFSCNLAGEDHHDITELVTRHRPMVLRVCWCVLRQWHDAQDACQATFLVLLRRASSFRPEGTIDSWLRGIAYRVSLNVLKRKRRCQQREAHYAPSSSAWYVHPEEDAVYREMHEIVHEEIRGLPSKYRAPLTLFDLQDKSKSEVARLLNIPEGTVASRVRKGRRLLRQRLLHRGITSAD
jgi:RNA polymerase sigma factor (sigma-70 family)